MHYSPLSVAPNVYYTSRERYPSTVGAQKSSNGPRPSMPSVVEWESLVLSVFFEINGPNKDFSDEGAGGRGFFKN